MYRINSTSDGPDHLGASHFIDRSDRMSWEVPSIEVTAVYSLSVVYTKVLTILFNFVSLQIIPVF